MPLSKKVALFAAIAFFMLMIGFGSLPDRANALSAVVPDKILHVVAYGILATLIYAALKTGLSYRGRIVVLVIASMGLVDEMIQSLFSYRTASVEDWLCDVLAAVVAVGICSMIARRRVLAT